MAQLVELFIYSKKVKTQDGRSFIKRSTRYNFREEGKEGRVPHYVTVKFTEDAFKDANVKLDDIKRGILVVDGSKIGLDDIWKVDVDDKGKEKYPVCWIRGGIKSFTPVIKEHEFHFDTSDVISEEAEAPEEINEGE